MIDLPNINFLATGTWEDNLIRLWDLRGPSKEGAGIQVESEEKTGGVRSTKSHGNPGNNHDIKKRSSTLTKKSSNKNKRSKTTRD